MRNPLKYSLKFSADPGGRSFRSWVKLVPVDEVIEYRGRRIEFSQAYLEQVVSESTRLNTYFDARADAHGGSAFRFPVLLEHRPSGTRYGDLLELKLSSSGKFTGLWGRFEWTEPTAQAIELKQVKHVSVHILPEYVVESGEKFGPVVSEVSLTADPFLTSIGTIQDTLDVQLSRRGFTALKTLKEEDMEEIVEILNAIVARLEAMEGRMDEISPPAEDAEETPDPQAEDDSPEGEPAEQEPDAEGAPADEPTEETVSEEEPLPIAASRELGRALEGLGIRLGRMEARMEDLESRPPIRLNTQPRGHQGLPPAAPKPFESFDDRVAHLMKSKGLSHLEATREAFKATQ